VVQEREAIAVIRVAFPIVGGSGWTGGLNYLVNLLTALREHAAAEVEPVLFCAPGVEQAAIDTLRPFLPGAPLQLSGLPARVDPWFRLGAGAILQRDWMTESALRRAGIDVVFQHFAWYGSRFRIPTLAWIADFQHRYLPQMFSPRNRLQRSIVHWGLAHAATQIMLSSEDARRDCESFIPASRGKTVVVPFAVRPAPLSSAAELAAVVRKYELPEKFFYLPNQFWKHKNHDCVVEALRLLKQSGLDITIAASGNLSDVRHPGHPAAVVEKIREYGLAGDIRILGMIPRDDVPRLMQAAAAVVNPSLFEGWSTSVEEAKSLAAPMVLSDLRVHREQTDGSAIFFDPHRPEDLARALREAWELHLPGPRVELERRAQALNAEFRARFAQRFGAACEQTVQRFQRRGRGSAR
jgi:glycosyltransferase involved in cell wall biosynthesis